MSKISVDQFLQNESKPAFVATVEPVDGHDDLIKVTPWAEASGCLCGHAVNIKKSALDGVTLTGDVHRCCGKSLKVVELHFKKGETLPLEEIF